jgi:hypothetical protein
MAEPSIQGSRHRSQPSVSRTNTSIRSASTQHGYIPQPIPALNPNERPEQPPIRRSFYTTNPDPTSDTEESAHEFMNIRAEDVAGQNMGYDNQPVANGSVPRKKPGGKNFIGGFVQSLRRIPRTMFRTAPDSSSPAPRQPVPPMAPATLPSYMLTPPSPAVPQQQPSVPFPQPDFETTDVFPQATSPHPTRIELDEQIPEHNPDREPNTPPMSRHTSQHHTINPSTHHNSFAYPSSYRDPPSVAAHPQPSPDYRRMSRHTGEESIHPHPISYASAESPSFSTELDRNPLRIFRALRPLLDMPWVSHDRVTVDYSPGMANVLRADSPEDISARASGGSRDKQITRWSIIDKRWKPWQRTSVFLTMDGRVVPPQDGPSALARGDARKGKMYIPVDKPLTSWYSGGHAGKIPRNRYSATSRASREVDLMSSGSDRARSSVGATPRRSAPRRRVSRSTLTSPSSPNSPSPIRRTGDREIHRHTPRRQSRRLYYSTDEYVFLDPGSTPGSSPMLARRAVPRPHPREVRRDRHAGVRRRRSGDTSRPPQPLMAPMPPASPYPLSPLVFLSPNHLDNAALSGMEPHSHPQTGTPIPGGVLGVTSVPMYMSILPGMPPPPPGSASGMGESSPPGFAGRGAGGGYGPGGYGPGYSVQGYTYPYPYSPPPQVHHEEDKLRSPQARDAQ